MKTVLNMKKMIIEFETQIETLLHWLSIMFFPEDHEEYHQISIKS